MSTVLIETLWNVKLYITEGAAEGVRGINRNIVECKEDTFVDCADAATMY